MVIISNILGGWPFSSTDFQGEFKELTEKTVRESGSQSYEIRKIPLRKA